MPLGLALAGWSARTIGVDTSLWIAAALVVATNLAILLVPDVRRFRALAATPLPQPFAEAEGESPVPEPQAQLP